MRKILFLCTGNSCRSIMAEGLMKHFGKANFQPFSAGSNPTGKIHPLSIKTLQAKGILTSGFFSKSWNELADTKIDIVITVCDNAAGETCPVFLGNSIKAHWGVSDPASFQGDEAELEQEFLRVCNILESRIKALCSLKIEKLSSIELETQLRQIGKI